MDESPRAKPRNDAPAAATEPSLDDFRGANAACLGCGYERRGLPQRSPCPECSRLPPASRAIVIRGAMVRGLAARGASMGLGCGSVSFAAMFAVLLIAAFALAALGRLVMALRAGASLSGIFLSWGFLLFVAVVAVAIYGILRQRRRRISTWVYSVAGPHHIVGGRAVRSAWNDTRSISTRRSMLRFRRRGWWRPSVYLRIDAPPAATAMIADALEGMRSAAESHPGASPSTRRYDRWRSCEACGAMRAQEAPADVCAVCGEALPAGMRLLFGLSSPRAWMRTLLAVGIPTVIAATVMLVFITATIVAGIAAMNEPPLLVLAAITALLSLTTARFLLAFGRPGLMVLRSRRTWADRVWILRPDRLDIASSDGVRAVPLAHITAVESRTAGGGWRRFRLQCASALPVPDAIWLPPSEPDSERVVDTLRQRLGTPRGAPPSAPVG